MSRGLGQRARSSAATFERGLRLLLLLAAESGCLTAKELEQRLGLPISTLYRYLGPLLECGLVRRVGRDGRYAVGPRAVSLWAAFRRNLDLVAAARPSMERLCQRTQETVLLTVVLGRRAMCVETVESPLPIHYSFRPGVDRPLYAGASAKALLAFLDDRTVGEVVAEARLHAPHLSTGLPDALRRIREAGYVVTQGEVDPDAWAVGVPVFGEAGVLEGAVSLVAPAFRTGPERVPLLVQHTLEAAREIERRLRGVQ
ncbi:MAG: IclR family transcriptional regulator [candidate division GAL15 bacterium]